MVNIDLDTLLIFNGQITEKNHLYFKGANATFQIVYYKDGSIVKSQGFYTVINPNNSKLIETIYLFKELTDALSFYHSKQIDYFSKALLIVFDMDSKDNIAKFINENYLLHKSKVPKLVFFHQPNSPDLYALYFDILNRNIIYDILYKNKELHFNITYKTIKLNLLFSELPKALKLLGINDRVFRIKNKVLSQERPQLNW